MEIRYNIDEKRPEAVRAGHFVIERTFSYGMHVCFVLLTDTGHRCGYVVLPKDNGEKYKGLPLEEIPVSCHGGVTYFEQGHPLIDTKQWIMGFDCAHFGGAIDMESLKKYYSDDETVIKTAEIMSEFSHGTIKDTQYVVDELINICNQLEDDYFKDRSKGEKVLARLILSLDEKQTEYFRAFEKEFRFERRF